MAETEIYLLRHGETVWNRERRVQGWQDSPLTLRGIRQAEGYGRKLGALLGEGLPGYRLISSPLGRAWQTAVILSEVAGADSTRIHRDPRVREIAWGRWEGLTAAEIEARDPELWQARLRDRFADPPPEGGESRSMLFERARGWLASLDEGERIVLVSHGGFGRALRCAYLGQGERGMLELADEPQDAFFRLWRNRIERIPADEEPALSPPSSAGTASV